MGASSCHALLIYWWVLGCRRRLSMEWQSHSSVGQDCGGLGEGDRCWLGYWGEGLWHCLDLCLPLKSEHHPLKLDCPAEVSSLSCLADSAPPRPTWGDWVCKAEWPWEHLWLLKEGLAGPVLLHRPALVMCLMSSWCSSLMHSSCCLWGCMLGTTLCSSCRLVLQLLGFLNQGPWKGLHRGVFSG